MNKGLYKHVDRIHIYWYKTWKNSSKNFGATIMIWSETVDPDLWTWKDCGDDDEEDSGLLVGAACLAQW